MGYIISLRHRQCPCQCLCQCQCHRQWLLFSDQLSCVLPDISQHVCAFESHSGYEPGCSSSSTEDLHMRSLWIILNISNCKLTIRSYRLC